MQKLIVPVVAELTEAGLGAILLELNSKPTAQVKIDVQHQRDRRPRPHSGLLHL